MTRMTSLRRALASGVAVLFLASACSATNPGQEAVPGMPAGSASPSLTPAPNDDGTGASNSDKGSGGETGNAAGIEQFYGQKPELTDCEYGKCGEITIPLDHDNPEAGQATLAFAVLPARGEKIGSLLINPGGPGGSGIDFLKSAEFVFTNRILDSYDIVGFDPRGVNKSTPVHCLSDAEMDDFLAASFRDTEEDQAKAAQLADDFIQSCLDKDDSGILGYVGTSQAARDMDILRDALGDPKLNYLGFSYGTFLGATYADYFPDRINRMVLDGAINPSVSGLDMMYTQTVGFEKAMEAYISACQEEDDCPLEGSMENAKKQILDLVNSLYDSPLPTSDDDRPLTPALATVGIYTPLYNEANWPYLTSGLRDAFAGYGDSLLFLADYMNSREADGYADNSNEAILAINCTDYPVQDDQAEIDRLSEKLAQEAPLFSELFGLEDSLCNKWPYHTGVRKEIHAPGAPPILVVGTTGDPATPYRWSEELAEQLESGVLITYQGEGHTAYSRNNQCVSQVVDAYLLDGDAPTENVNCASPN